jgi:hypothetical protein
LKKFFKKMTTTERNSGTIIIILLMACGLTLCHGLTEAKAGTFLAPPKNPGYSVQDGFLTISWEAVIGATGYRLHISDSPNNHPCVAHRSHWNRSLREGVRISPSV